MPISKQQLVEIAKIYWRPDKEYSNSPEHGRLVSLWDQELQRLHRWWALLDELKTELPGFTIGNATATPDACLRCAAYFPVDEGGDSRRLVVVGCVSILAPVYVVYGVEYERVNNRRRNPRVFHEPLPAEMRHPADVITRRIEADYGANALPRDIAEVRIPLFVEPMEPPNTTLFHALFTSEPESLP